MLCCLINCFDSVLCVLIYHGNGRIDVKLAVICIKMAVLMKKAGYKLALVKILQQSNVALSLPELLTHFEQNTSARSVRRWLNEMVTDGLVEKHGQKRGTRYVAVIKKLEKTDVVSYIKQPLFKRQPISYNYAWLHDYQPNVTRYLPILSLRAQRSNPLLK